MLGFSPKWVNLVSLVNGVHSKFFAPSCGLRKGDPLSPYLFILVSQMLSANLSLFASQSVCRGIVVSPCSPPISHMFFCG